MDTGEDSNTPETELKTAAKAMQHSEEMQSEAYEKILEVPFEQARERQYFIDNLQGAEMHWFFIQGIEAIQKGLYLPGVLSLINGIEASLRITMHQLNDFYFDEELSDYQVLSNCLDISENYQSFAVASL